MYHSAPTVAKAALAPDINVVLGNRGKGGGENKFIACYTDYDILVKTSSLYSIFFFSILLITYHFLLISKVGLS